tara:strand:+ start:987 stop:2030 length:1044 start_codon:yes stop_codon:yes gene_type:complete
MSSFFRTAGEYEKKGDLKSSLETLINAKRDKKLSGIEKIITNEMERIINKCGSFSKIKELGTEAFHEHAENPNNYKFDKKSPKPIVSITTISTRIKTLSKTIESIKNQTFPPQSINLYISSEPYLIDVGFQKNNNEIKKIIELGVNVYFTKNIGPYRKQYPIIFQLLKLGADPDTPIITMDDDVVYPDHIVEMLMEEYFKRDAVIAHRGRQIVFSNNGLGAYKNFIPPEEKLSHLNIGTGKNGICYRLKHFPKDRSYYIGPILAPTADDIWCKWVTSSKCVPTYIIEPEAAYNSTLDFKESNPGEKNCLFHKYNASGKNDIAINNMETFFNFKLKNIFDLYGVNKNG